MNFHVLTLFPEMIEQGLHTSILGKAMEKAASLWRPQTSGIFPPTNTIGWTIIPTAAAQEWLWRRSRYTVPASLWKKRLENPQERFI